MSLTVTERRKCFVAMVVVMVVVVVVLLCPK
jgi:hypothetical protein